MTTFDPPEVLKWDLSLVEGEVRRVAASRVVDLLCVSDAPDTIAIYRTAMARGEAFPPVAVVPVLGRLIIADGHKRFQAAWGLAVNELPVEVWSWRRVLADLLDQARATGHRLGHVIHSLTVGRNGRQEAAIFVAHEVAHLRRMVVSLLAALRGR